MSFLDTLHAAKDTTSPTDYIKRVKRAVYDELQALDPTSTIETTPYFNHTAVPDFVVSWPGDSEKRNTPQRQVFLRHSYRSIAEDGDEYYLAQSDAMLLSLAPNETSPPRKVDDNSLSPESGVPRLLVTDSEAIQVVGELRPEHAGRPLGELVRANFVRGAKGHIDPLAAMQLIELDEPASTMSTRSATELISASFSEEAAARITRTAQLIDMALYSTDPGTDGLVGGRLSRAELRHLLPWLLSRDPSSVRPEFWRYIGTLFGFKELESIREDLLDFDLTPLVQANGDIWGARRAYVGLAISNDAEGDPRDAISRRWGFQPGSLSALSVDLGERRLYLASGGTLLKPRPADSSATWEQVHETIKGEKLRRVDLHGIRRSVSINAEQSPDIQSDVEEIARSLDDDYFVSAVTLRFSSPGDAEGSVDIDVHFDQNLVVAAASDASLADLTRTALGVLDYRDPATKADIDELLGRSESSQHPA